MLECVTSFNLAEHFFGHVYDPPTGQWGYTRVVNPTRKPFPTKDGYIGLLPYTDQQWDQFFEIAGWGETLSARTRASPTTPPACTTCASSTAWSIRSPSPRTTDEWLALLEAAADPGGEDEHARRPAERSAPGRGRLLRALRAPGGRRLPRHEARRSTTPRRPPTCAAIRRAWASTRTRCWPRSTAPDVGRIGAGLHAPAPDRLHRPARSTRSPTSSARCSG